MDWSTTKISNSFSTSNDVYLIKTSTSTDQQTSKEDLHRTVITTAHMHRLLESFHGQINANLHCSTQLSAWEPMTDNTETISRFLICFPSLKEPSTLIRGLTAKFWVLILDLLWLPFKKVTLRICGFQTSGSVLEDLEFVLQDPSHWESFIINLSSVRERSDDINLKSILLRLCSREATLFVWSLDVFCFDRFASQEVRKRDIDFLTWVSVYWKEAS